MHPLSLSLCALSEVKERSAVLRLDLFSKYSRRYLGES